MKYSEFKRGVEAMGYSIAEGQDNVYITKGEHIYLISVGLRSTYTIDSEREPFGNLEDLEKERLLSLAWQLASTPLEGRKDEKRYRLRADLPQIKSKKDRNELWLNVNTETNEYFLSYHEEQLPKFKTVFTESELEDIDETGFVREEVRA